MTSQAGNRFMPYPKTGEETYILPVKKNQGFGTKPFDNKVVLAPYFKGDHFPDSRHFDKKTGSYESVKSPWPEYISAFLGMLNKDQLIRFNTTGHPGLPIHKEKDGRRQIICSGATKQGTVSSACQCSRYRHVKQGPCKCKHNYEIPTGPDGSSQIIEVDPNVDLIIQSITFIMKVLIQKQPSITGEYCKDNYFKVNQYIAYLIMGREIYHILSSPLPPESSEQQCVDYLNEIMEHPEVPSDFNEEYFYRGIAVLVRCNNDLEEKFISCYNMLKGKFQEDPDTKEGFYDESWKDEVLKDQKALYGLTPKPNPSSSLVSPMRSYKQVCGDTSRAQEGSSSNYAGEEDSDSALKKTPSVSPATAVITSLTVDEIGTMVSLKSGPGNKDGEASSDAETCKDIFGNLSMNDIFSLSEEPKDNIIPSVKERSNELIEEQGKDIKSILDACIKKEEQIQQQHLILAQLEKEYADLRSSASQQEKHMLEFKDKVVSLTHKPLAWAKCFRQWCKLELQNRLKAQVESDDEEEEEMEPGAGSGVEVSE